jgi:hypothetical protein
MRQPKQLSGLASVVLLYSSLNSPYFESSPQRWRVEDHPTRRFAIQLLGSLSACDLAVALDRDRNYHCHESYRQADESQVPSVGFLRCRALRQWHRLALGECWLSVRYLLV